ncbi:MAG: ribonuclease III [Woeseiaceae bacterium]|nr:ribonuclease III [Woeseiaceae bacterium]
MNKRERWLSETLDYRFRDSRLFELALTHRSSSGASNERLEFLGDAVLDFVVSDHVYRAMPDADEGDLSRLRASLVKDTSLAELARDLGLGEHLILGSGEQKTGGHRRESILADALEAVFGAVYLDAGYDAARAVVELAFGTRFDELPDPRELRDPKTRLQEWLQARGRGLPDYELVNVSGKAHRQTFEVRCTVTDSELATDGDGSSRRNAEQQAAERMLVLLAKGES